MQGAGVNALQNSRGTEQGKGQEHRPVVDAVAAGAFAVALQQALLVGDAAGAQVQAVEAAHAVDAVGHVVRQAAVGQVGERVADGGQFPVKHRHHVGGAVIHQQVTEAEVAVGDGGAVVLGNIVRQPRHQVVHGRHFIGLGGFVLGAPALHLALHVALGLAEIAQAGGLIVDAVQLGQGVDLVVVKVGALVLGQGFQLRLGEHPAGHEIHHVEAGADHVIVFAQQVHGRHRHLAVFAERLHDAVFPVHLVGGRQHLARRLLAQHVFPVAALQQVGGVGLPALELAHLERAVEQIVLFQVLGETRLIQAVRLKHRDDFRLTFHNSSSNQVRGAAVGASLLAKGWRSHPAGFQRPCW